MTKKTTIIHSTNPVFGYNSSASVSVTEQRPPPALPATSSPAESMARLRNDGPRHHWFLPKFFSNTRSATERAATDVEQDVTTDAAADQRAKSSSDSIKKQARDLLDELKKPGVNVLSEEQIGVLKNIAKAPKTHKDAGHARPLSIKCQKAIIQVLEEALPKLPKPDPSSATPTAGSEILDSLLSGLEYLDKGTRGSADKNYHSIAYFYAQKKACQLIIDFSHHFSPTNRTIHIEKLLAMAGNFKTSSYTRETDVQGTVARYLGKQYAAGIYEAKDRTAIARAILPHIRKYSMEPPAGHSGKANFGGFLGGYATAAGGTMTGLSLTVGATATTVGAFLWPVLVGTAGAAIVGAAGTIAYKNIMNYFIGRNSIRDTLFKMCISLEELEAGQKETWKKLSRNGVLPKHLQEGKKEKGKETVKASLMEDNAVTKNKINEALIDHIAVLLVHGEHLQNGDDKDKEYFKIIQDLHTVLDEDHQQEVTKKISKEKARLEKLKDATDSPDQRISVGFANSAPDITDDTKQGSSLSICPELINFNSDSGNEKTDVNPNSGGTNNQVSSLVSSEKPVDIIDL